MKLKTLCAAVALAASTTLSFAGGSATVLKPTGPNLFGAVFTQTSSADVFADTFEFAALPSASTVVFSLFGVLGPVEFFVADVIAGGDSQSFSFFPEDGPLNRVRFQTSIAANTPFSLTVLGAGVPLAGEAFATGFVTYAGAVVASVPEPETYALLMAGLVGVGAAARRKQRAAAPLAA